MSGPDFLHWRDIFAHLVFPPFLVIAGALLWLFRVASDGFFDRYLVCLLATTVWFLGGSVVKCYALYLQIVNAGRAKRGFFSVSQRVLILTRGILVFPEWFRYFRSLRSEWALWVYLVLKAGFIAVFVVSLPVAWMRYEARKGQIATRVREEEVKDDCAVCLCAPTEPCKLPCGHIFCQECLERWLMTNPSCPICRREMLKATDVGWGEAGTDWVFFLLPF
jgi:hypothetical protein